MITYNVFLLLCSQVSAYRGNIFSHYADSTCFSISRRKLVSFRNYPSDHNDQWIILPCHSFQSLLGDPLCCCTQNCLLWQWYASWSQEQAFKSMFTKRRQKKPYFEKINLWVKAQNSTHPLPWPANASRSWSWSPAWWMTPRTAETGLLVGNWMRWEWRGLRLSW